MRISKKALSNVISAILLILIVVVLAGIIFAWAKSTIKTPTKIAGENADFACDKVRLSSLYIKSSGLLQVTNIGNINLEKTNVLQEALGEITNSKEAGINSGESLELNISKANEKVYIIPVLKDDNRKEYSCKNKIEVENAN